ncbi:MAG: hypothetical protein QNK37_02150 [Acidobacteriota bacterium]|nr:hypothetical protein [Acidobacteriota bacterium]
MPAQRLKTTCNGCTTQFAVDKTTNLNCKVEKVFDEEGWTVENPACKGMVYSLTEVEGLVRSGMVNRETRLTPPGVKTLRAGEVEQLGKAFEIWDKRNN